MKQLISIISMTLFFSCKQDASKIEALQNRVDSLETKLTNTFKPGLGEFMSGMQSHHSKLWFAGESHNWKLARFEVKELKEMVTDIIKYQTERKETQLMGTINPALDSIKVAIQQENTTLFTSSFTLLTSACNNCHFSTNFEYNVVKTPDISPFSNQDFKVKK